MFVLIKWNTIEDELDYAKKANGDIKKQNGALIQANKAILDSIVYSDDVVAKYGYWELRNFMLGFGEFAETAAKYYDHIKPHEELKEKQSELRQKVADVEKYTKSINKLIRINKELLGKEEDLLERKEEHDRLIEKINKLSALNKINDRYIENLEARLERQEGNLKVQEEDINKKLILLKNSLSSNNEFLATDLEIKIREKLRKWSAQ